MIANALNTDLEASAYWIDDQFDTTMKFDEIVTEGQARLNVVQLALVPNPREKVEDEEEDEPLFPL